MEKKIIVIGSIHLDILAYYKSKHIQFEDNIGQVELGIGGTAFNIASNLKGLEHDVDLCSVINRNRFTGKIVYEAIGIAGFRKKYILHDPAIGNSAFVGHLSDGDLQCAVSSMEVEHSMVIYDSIDKIVSEYTVIVIDCNLSKELIKKVCILANEKNKSVIAAATSEPKSLRLIGSSGFHGLCMNRKEATALKEKIEANQDKELLDYFSSSQLLITEGEKGALFWPSVNQEPEKIPAPELGKITSPIGAGDAACAGYVDSVLQDIQPSISISNCIRKVLQSHEPNLLSSRLSPEALHKTWKKQHKRTRIVKMIAWASGVGGGIIFIFELLKLFMENMW